ncbi:MAG: D-alanyl-D-alanine carboxypeptidase, partial [candidate division Zixibacteria bacterium]|nr:D-alanyl-D-alanine carboxypeptidase [candidate division Zixibacteria bacterium]
MKSKFIRLLIYGILIWVVSASYSHYISTTSAGKGYWLDDGDSLFGSIYEKIMPGSMNIRARAALAVDAESGEIYFSKNKDTQMPIASLTKLATALVFFETKPDLSGTVTIIDSDFPGVSRSKLYPGETIELSDCLHLSLMCSDNAAMRALARSTGLGNREFIGRMNDLAGKLGMDQTHFTDPTGLDAGNLSTAADYIKLLRRAYLNET